MKKIYILRHAKAEHNSKIDDHERPLSVQGAADCRVLAEYMQAQHIMPDIILCSPSSRTQGTIEAIAEHYPLTAPIQLLPSLYLASAGEIFSAINRVENTVSSLLISGHNPGLHQLALLLSSKNTSDDALAPFKINLPTASLITFECDVRNWQDVEVGSGKLVGFFKGRAV